MLALPNLQEPYFFLENNIKLGSNNVPNITVCSTYTWTCLTSKIVVGVPL